MGDTSRVKAIAPQRPDNDVDPAVHAHLTAQQRLSTLVSPVRWSVTPLSVRWSVPPLTYGLHAQQLVIAAGNAC
jgi:hypothetical protein